MSPFFAHRPEGLRGFDVLRCRRADKRVVGKIKTRLQPTREMVDILAYISTFLSGFLKYLLAVFVGA